MCSSWEQESSHWTVLWHVGWAAVLFGLVLLLGRRRQEKPSKLPLGRKDCQTSSSQISITRLLGDDGMGGPPCNCYHCEWVRSTAASAENAAMCQNLYHHRQIAQFWVYGEKQGFNQDFTRLPFFLSKTSTQFTQCVYTVPRCTCGGQVTILGVCLIVSSALSLFYSLLLLTTTIAYFVRILGAGLSRDTEEIKKNHWESTALFHRF